MVQYSASLSHGPSTCVDGPWAWTAGYDNLVGVSTGGRTFAAVRLVADLIVCALILLGNSFIICALLHQRWCRKDTLCPRFRVSSLFVISLVMADLLGGCSLLFHLVTQNVCFVAELLPRHRLMCLLRTVGLFFSASISLASLAAISIDRYVAVLHSLRYPELMTRRRAGFIICASWMYASIGSISLFFWNEWQPGRPCHEADNIPLRHALFVGLPMYLGVAFLLVVTHVLIRREVKKMQIRRRNTPGNIFGVQIEKNSEKSVRAVILVIGCFLLCWLPITTFLLLRLCGYQSPTLEVGLQVAYSLANVSAVLNPFIYSWKNASVRNALLQFRKKLTLLIVSPPHRPIKGPHAAIATAPRLPNKSISSVQSSMSVMSSISSTSASSTSTGRSFLSHAGSAYGTPPLSPSEDISRQNKYSAFTGVM